MTAEKVSGTVVGVGGMDLPAGLKRPVLALAFISYMTNSLLFVERLFVCFVISVKCIVLL